MSERFELLTLQQALLSLPDFDFSAKLAPCGSGLKLEISHDALEVTVLYHPNVGLYEILQPSNVYVKLKLANMVEQLKTMARRYGIG